MSSVGKNAADKKISRLENLFQKSSPKNGKLNKQSNSSLSPIDKDQSSKKPSMASKADDSANMDPEPSASDDTSLKQIIGPLIDEVKLLQE